MGTVTCCSPGCQLCASLGETRPTLAELALQAHEREQRNPITWTAPGVATCDLEAAFKRADQLTLTEQETPSWHKPPTASASR